MADRSCVELLQWLLPRLGLRWRGFKNVRRQVCRRLHARARALGCADLDAYRARLEVDPAELALAASLCRVTISRFYRDRAVFDALRRVVLPRLASQQTVVRVLSAGCASGEEPFTLALIWDIEFAPRHPDVAFEIVAVDLDDEVLARAREGLYDESSLAELPAELRDRGFEREGEAFRLKPEHRRRVKFLRANVREELPEGPFDLVLCRNLAFTYFDEGVQREMLRRFAERLRAGGLLVLGTHERLPPGVEGFEVAAEVPCAHRRR